MKLKNPTVRIALVTYAMHCGGMEMFILRLGKYLQDKGMLVDVVVLEEKGEWFTKITEHRLEGIFLNPSNIKKPLNKIIHLFRTIRFFIQKDYDLIFINHAMYAQRALPFMKLFNHTKVIPILHNNHSQIYKAGLLYPVYYDAVVGVSPLICQVAKEKVKLRMVHFIPNGVEEPEQLGLSPTRNSNSYFNIVYVGRFEHQQKGIFYLPKIIGKCVTEGLNIKFTLIGSGPDERELRRMVDEKGLSEHVSFLGVLDSKEIYGVLLRSQCLLMPSFFEGLGIVLLEAQICGCVPIATKLESVTTIAVQDGDTGFLIDGNDNIEMFYQKINILYHDPSQWERMSKNGVKFAKRRFSLEATGNKYIKLINAVLS